MSTSSVPVLCVSPSPESRRLLTERTDRLLLRIIRANVKSQYASQTSVLAEFRDAVAVHGTTRDASLLASFRSLVPISYYDSYQPFVAKFDQHPCTESEVKDLFAPGLPYYLGLSSSTSGNAPKVFARYHHLPTERPLGPRHPMAGEITAPTAWVYYIGYKDLKEIQGEDGRLIKIPFCQATNAVLRMRYGWSPDKDDSLLSTITPGHAAPWAVSLVNHHQSFLLLHILFALTRPDLERIYIAFATVLADMIRLADEKWDMLLTCIQNGAVPDLDGIAHVRPHLEAHLRANQERAHELRVIGPPCSSFGWAAQVWPNLNMVCTICSGTFATALSTVRYTFGPNIAIHSPGYGSTEGVIGVPFTYGNLDQFIPVMEDVIEYLEVTAEATHENILQAWDLEVGKLYEVILTTRDGLWRYALGDIVEVVGFSSDSGFPVFKFSGRKSMAMRFPPAPQITDAHLVEAIRAISTPDIIPVQEFTTVVDQRELPPTVGFFVEVAGLLGPNAHLAVKRIFEAFVSVNPMHNYAIERKAMRLPTVRVVKPGTFMEYRLWKAERTRAGIGQLKLPAVVQDDVTREWIEQRVIQEL